MPVDRDGRPLAFDRRLARDPAALAWLWKDHTSVAEAEEITALAAQRRPEYLAKCGGRYSSEWFFSKIFHCLRSSPRVFDAAHTWVEIADWIPAMLTGSESPERLTRGVCAAGHKAMYNEAWGGYPDAEFLAALDPRLGALRQRLASHASTIDRTVGGLTAEWGRRTGLPVGIPVAVGAIDAHLGAVGSGIAPGTLVKIIGTSTCDMMVVPTSQALADVPGLCGIVEGSILPGYFGLEAGQSAVGDIFNWFVAYIQPGGPRTGSHEALSAAAGRLKPGASGLLALDWNNGNRTVLVDQRLTGLLMGQTLYTTPGEIYRALVEATAFGALTIINRFEEYGVRVEQIVNCGGIAEKSPLTMQVYADVTGRAMKVARSGQTCALGAAIAGAVVRGRVWVVRRGPEGDVRPQDEGLSSEFSGARGLRGVVRALPHTARRVWDAGLARQPAPRDEALAGDSRAGRAIVTASPLNYMRCLRCPSCLIRRQTASPITPSSR
jgi:L-ribulokinase